MQMETGLPYPEENERTVRQSEEVKGGGILIPKREHTEAMVKHIGLRSFCRKNFVNSGLSFPDPSIMLHPPPPPPPIDKNLLAFISLQTCPLA